MSAKNPEYDFKWCPGCGDFGVRRAIEFALKERSATKFVPVENTVIVAGIGCSGNLVHLLEGPQPFGIHGIHGRTLPIAFGVKMARPELNVLIVAGDGDFLSIGAEHIGPQAQRNLNVCAIVMDNGVYGLTKGQSSPTSNLGQVTSSTPYGKVEGKLNPLELYLSLGASFVAGGFSGKPRELAKLITMGMDYPGFAIVHVQSPCTTYNDTYDYLKGDAKKNMEPTLFDIPATHDPSNWEAAYKIARSPGVPVGILYQAPDPEPLEQRVESMKKKGRARTAQDLVESFNV